MSSNNNTSIGGGSGFAAALALLFIALKLTDTIDWPWMWVLAPLWIPAAVVVVILVIGGVIALIVALVSGRSDRGVSTPVIVIGALVLLLALPVGVWGFRVLTADAKGEGDQRIQTRGDANYRIAAYDRFFDLCASIQALEDQLGVMRADKSLPPDQRATNILALTNQRNTLIRQYNADAAKADTRGHFLSSDLPYSIDTSQETTSCAA